MIDHLLIAVDEPTLAAAIGSIIPVGPNPQPLWDAANSQWRPDIALPVTVYNGSTPQTVTNPDGSTSTVQIPTPVSNQYALWVGLPSQDPNLSASPCCSLVANRDLAQAGNPNFILQTSMTQAQLDTYTISPVLMGTNYPFGNAP